METSVGLGRRQPAAPVPPAAVTLYEDIPEAAPADEPEPTVGDIIPLAAAMRRHIERALTATRGRIEGKGGAADLLEINPHTLRARMRKLEIDPGQFRR